jgi:uncharacterized protein (TIGR02266 family)
MPETPLTPLLKELEELLARVQSALQSAREMEGRLPAVAELESALSASSSLVQHQLDVSGLRDELEADWLKNPPEDVHGSLGRSLKELLHPVKQALVQAVALGMEFSERSGPLVDEAMKHLIVRKSELEVFSGRIAAAVDERQRRAEELRRLAEEAPQAYEVTRPFDDEPVTAAWDAEEPAGEERRRHPRDELSLTVRLEAPNRLLAAGSSENVSVGGIFIATEYPYELGAMLHVSCLLGEGQVVEVEAVVAWIRQGSDGVEPGIGLEFLALSEEGLEAFEKAVGAGLATPR